MKNTTVLGTEIDENIRGILYLCEFNRKELSLKVTNEILFESAFIALEAYANIPNPESQLITGKTYEELLLANAEFEKNMVDKDWLNELSECL